MSNVDSQLVGVVTPHEARQYRAGKISDGDFLAIATKTFAEGHTYPDGTWVPDGDYWPRWRQQMRDMARGIAA